MVYPVSYMSGLLYRHVAKPLLFTLKPDSVHEHMVAISKRLQRFGLLRRLVATAWAYQKPAMLRQTFAGITYPNPVGLSAGFDKNVELLPILHAIGFGQTEVGSITALPCPGNPRPWFYRLPKSKALVVNAGLANKGCGEILPRTAQVLQEYPHLSVLNISLAKTNSPDTADQAKGITDYVAGLHAIKNADIGDVITLNISCPNAYGGEPFVTSLALEELLTATDNVNVRQPLYLKMPIDLSWEQFKQLLAVADAHNVAGLTIGNLAKDRTKMKLKDPLPDATRGNMGGKPTWELSNDLIRRTRMAYPDRFVIVGVGGISNAEDAYTKIRLGANMVELVTGLIFEGPQVVGQINRGLVRLLQRDGYSHISQAVGVDATV